MRHPLKTLLILCVILAACSSVNAQQFCKRKSVFFELDKAELSADSKRKLDSIVTFIGARDYLIEMYGHTDSLASNDYNYRLAATRMDSVKKYILTRTKSHLEFKEKNLGETSTNISRSAEANLAFNRRVDIYLIPLQNNRLVLKGERGESIELPENYFEPCGVCNSAPVVNTYYTPEEGAKKNLVFASTDGTPLITAGTFVMDAKPCNGNASGIKDTARILIRIPADKYDPEMSVWEADTVNGKIYWTLSKQKPQYDPVTKTYLIWRDAGVICNLDKKVQIVECALVVPKEFTYTHNILSREKKQKELPAADTVAIDNPDSVAVLHAFAKTNEHYYYLRQEIDSLPGKRVRNDNYTVKTFYAPFEQYSEFVHSDTLLKVRCKKAVAAEQFGYYLKEFNEFIPISENDGKYYKDQKLNSSYQYAFIKKGKLYAASTKKLKVKYDRRNNTVKLKCTKKTAHKFRAVKEYKVVAN